MRSKTSGATQRTKARARKQLEAANVNEQSWVPVLPLPSKPISSARLILLPDFADLKKGWDERETSELNAMALAANEAKDRRGQRFRMNKFRKRLELEP